MHHEQHVADVSPSIKADTETETDTTPHHAPYTPTMEDFDMNRTRASQHEF
eukprot:m.111423 g.111423  ORF g.111423 m.111423 type:complete len:51 (-) comp28120_c0_seq1:172-324(-)